MVSEKGGAFWRHVSANVDLGASAVRGPLLFFPLQPGGALIFSSFLEGIAVCGF